MVSCRSVLPGMSAHESQFAIARSFRIPFQEMLDLGRLAVFVSAENADIEIEARDTRSCPDRRRKRRSAVRARRRCARRRSVCSDKDDKRRLGKA